MQRFADGLSERFKIKPKKVQAKDILSLHLYLKTMESPERATQALKFVLLHELGHIDHQHGNTTQGNNTQFTHQEN